MGYEINFLAMGKNTRHRHEAPDWSDYSPIMPLALVPDVEVSE